MNRASLLCVVIGASAVLSACDLPTVTFSDTGTGGAGAPGSGSSGGTGGVATTTTPGHTGGGGAGGAGATGGTGGTGGATTTTTTTSTTGGAGGAGGAGGGPVEPTLQCSYPVVTDCMPGQVCCLDKTDPYQDKCAEPGKCTPQSDYGEASCSSDAECGPGQHCCMYFVLNVMTQKYDVQGIYCDTECSIDNDELPACSGATDCLDNAPYLICDSVLGYPEYKFCQTP